MCVINNDVRQSHVKAIFFLGEHSLEAMNFSTPNCVFYFDICCSTQTSL